MDEIQIQKAVNKIPLLKHNFLGCFPLDKLPCFNKIGSCFIANLDLSHMEGSHWVAVFFTSENCIEYFDTFGRPPPKEFHESFIVKNYNKKIVQSLTSDSCGHFCVFYLIFKTRGFSMSDIVNFVNVKTNADKYVENFINKLN